MQPNTRINAKFGICPIVASIGDIPWFESQGKQLRTWAAVLIASAQYFFSIPLSLIMHRTISINVRLNLSTIPSHIGWYGEVHCLLIPYNLHSSLIFWDSKFVPWSLKTILIAPCREITSNLFKFIEKTRLIFLLFIKIKVWKVKNWN